MNDTLYFIGGAGCLNQRDQTIKSVRDIDIWNNEISQWCLQNEMVFPRHGHSIAYLGKWITVMQQIKLELPALNTLILH
jgi:hypothetical protein